MTRPTINNLDLYALNAANLCRQQEEVDRTIDNFGGAEALNIVVPYEAWKAGLTDLSKTVRIARASTATPKIADLDKNIGIAFGAIKSEVKTRSKHFSPTVSASAKNIQHVLKTYANITDESLDEQMFLVKRFLEDLENKCAQDIENVGIGDWVERLKTLNNEMLDLNTERIGEVADKSESSMKAAKTRIIPLYKDVCTVIAANVIVEGGEKYREFIKFVNAANSKFGAKGNDDDGVGDIAPDVPQDYPDAKEWLEDLPFMGVENGDIYYIMVDEKKVFYKLIDKQKFFWHPESERAAGGWEKLS